MKRKPLVGISMKLYKNVSNDMIDYATHLKESFQSPETVDVFLLPSMGTLHPVADALKNSSILYGSQNMAHIKNGALTGEFSIESLLELGGTLVELGHYERRTFLHETHDLINQKVRLALSHGVSPIICIGEPEGLDEEAATAHLMDQIESAFNGCEPSSLTSAILAYEPYWAIGQAEAASPLHVHRMHNLIRGILTDLYNKETAQGIRMIYGGSVSKDTAGDILNHEDVDGVFVGRFGHDVNQFMEIVRLVKDSKPN